MGARGPDTVSTVSFLIRDRTGRELPSSHFDVYKEKSVLPLSRRITPSVPLRLPYGRWSIDTQYNILQRHYEPRTFELSQPDAEVEIRLDIDLVPVNVVALGYRGEAQTLGKLEFFQFGRRGSSVRFYAISAERRLGNLAVAAMQDEARQQLFPE